VCCLIHWRYVRRLPGSNLSRIKGAWPGS
jgi:hypothetical protein